MNMKLYAIVLCVGLLLFAAGLGWFMSAAGKGGTQGKRVQAMQEILKETAQ